MIQRLNGHDTTGRITVQLAYTTTAIVLIGAGLMRPPRAHGTRWYGNRYGRLVGCVGEVNESLWLRSVAFVGNDELAERMIARILNLDGWKPPKGVVWQ
jgi:hypothetical protein